MIKLFVATLGGWHHHHRLDSSQDHVTMGLNSSVESNMHMLLDMALGSPNCLILLQLQQWWIQIMMMMMMMKWWWIRVPLLLWVAPNIQPYWILECLSESKPKPKLPATPGSCLANSHLHEQMPSTPDEEVILKGLYSTHNNYNIIKE